MNREKRWIPLMVICICVLLTTAMNQQVYGIENTQDTAKVTLDGEVLSFEEPPANINGNVLVPMRAIFEAMGASVEWDNDGRVALGQLEGKKVEIPIGSKTVMISGLPVSINEPAQIINEKTFVPVRVVSEGLGATVEWNQEQATVVIKSPLKIEVPIKPSKPPVSAETENLEKLGVVYPQFSHYSQFGWGLNSSTESSMCVATCWAMLINNLGIPANPVDVYVANDKSYYLTWSKMKTSFGVDTGRNTVNDLAITEKATSQNSKEYEQAALKQITEALEKNPQGVILNFNQGMNEDVHSIVVVKEDDTFMFCDPSRGEKVSFEESYIYKRGQGWGNLYTIQTVYK